MYAIRSYYAEKAVKIDEGNREAALAAYDELFESLHGGSMWCYLPGKPRGEGKS